jgi:cytochrome d ubiquinol oxidase subunit I
MNVPTGFDLHLGQAENILPWKAMWNPMAAPETIHMVIAALAAVGFVVAGIHAKVLLKSPRSGFHLRGFAIALVVGGFGARAVAHNQPVKLAAMEGLWNTERGAGLTIGGIPNSRTETTPYGIEIPYVLSLLVAGDPNAKVIGLKAFPVNERPPVGFTHIAFQVMVGLGFSMMGIAGLAVLIRLRRRTNPWPLWFLRLMVFASPAGLLAIEAGWITTEVGRQPWIVSGIMRSADAVTPIHSLLVPLIAFTSLYAILGFVTLSLLRLQVFQSHEEGNESVA